MKVAPQKNTIGTGKSKIKEIQWGEEGNVGYRIKERSQGTTSEAQTCNENRN
jgi:hypothetical protein